MLLALFALLGAGTVRVLGRRFAHLHGVDRFLGAAVLFTAGILVAHIVPLCLGVLSRGAVVATAAILAGIAFALSRTAPPAAPEAASDRDPAPEESALLRRGVWLLTLGAGALALGFLSRELPNAVEQVDFMEFHGPAVASWIQEGSLWDIVSLYPLHTSGYYPNNGDVLLLSVTLPWRSDFMVRLVDVPYLITLGVALWAAARELGAGRATAHVYALLAVCLPVVVLVAVIAALPDTLMLACFATGVLFLLRHRRTGLASDLVLAGMALGIALGTKWYGLSAVALLLIVWAVYRFVIERPAIAVRQAAVLGAALIPLGSVWFARNAAATGNPFFPVKLAPGGVTILDAPRDVNRERYGSTIADYLTDFSALRHDIFPLIYRLMLGPGGIFLAALVVAAAAVAVRALLARNERTGWDVAAVAALAGAALAIGIAYVVTPYTAQTENGLPVKAWVNVRYATPMLLLAVPLAALLTQRGGRWLRPVLLALAALFTLDAMRRSFLGNFADVSLPRFLAGAAVLTLAAALVRLRPRRDVAVAAALGLVVAIVAGHELQQRFLDDRYDALDPTIAWVNANAPEDTRIGFAGVWTSPEWDPLLAMFGPRFRNEVEYIGPVRRGILNEYAERREFQDAVNHGNFDLVVVQERPKHGPSREETWLRELGFVTAARSPALMLLSAGSPAPP